MSLSTAMTWIWHTLMKHRVEWDPLSCNHSSISCIGDKSFTSFGKALLLEFASHFRISCSQFSLSLSLSLFALPLTTLQLHISLLTLAPCQSELQLCLMHEIHIWVSAVHQTYNGDFIKLGGVERIFSPLKKKSEKFPGEFTTLTVLLCYHKLE